MIRITDESEASELLHRARAVPPWRSPNWLAAPNMSARYTDTRLFSPDGPRFLREILDREGDDAAYLVMLRPDPSEYVQATGGFPILKFSPSESNEVHYQTAFYDPTGDVFGLSTIGDVIIVFGNKPSWSIYQERDVDMALVIVIFNPELLQLPGQSWRRSEDVLRRLPAGTPMLS